MICRLQQFCRSFALGPAARDISLQRSPRTVQQRPHAHNAMPGASNIAGSLTAQNIIQARTRGQYRAR